MKSFLKIVLPIFLLSIYACEDEPVEKIQFSDRESISVNSEFYDNITRIASEDPETQLVCLDFVYSFSIIVFNVNQEIDQIVTVEDDQDFLELLSTLPEGFYISMSYPITATTDAGDQILIQNNSDLREIIELCLQEEILEYCNNLLTADNCTWTVISSENQDADFIGSSFEVSDSGIVEYNYNGNSYVGTWVTFFIEDDLHLNINLDNNGSAANAWNFDWMVEITNNNQMTLRKNNTAVTIERDCDSICSTLQFEACETVPGSGIAEFPLDQYLHCIYNFINLEWADPTQATFHLTEQDAIDFVDWVDIPYVNTGNPEILYMRIENSITGEVIIVAIELTVVGC